MDITIQCPACHRSYRVGDASLGSTAKCNVCGHVFVIPWLPPPSEDPFKFASIEPTVKRPPPETPKWELPPVPVIEPRAASLIDGEDGIKPHPFGGRNSGPRHIGIVVASYILFFFVGACVLLGATETAQAFFRQTTRTITWPIVIYIWEWIVCIVAMLFLVNGPMLLLGVWGAFRIVHFDLVKNAYQYCCAVAAIPTVLFAVGWMNQDVPRIVPLLAIIPVAFFLLKLFFDLNWAGGGVGFALGAIAWILSMQAGNFIVEQIVPISRVTQFLNESKSANSGQYADSSDASSSGGGSGSMPGRTPNEQALSELRQSVNRSLNADYSQVTREQMAPSVADFRRRLELLKPKFRNDPQLDELSQAIETYEQKVMTLPSGKIDPSIFEDVPDADDWTTGNLSRAQLAPEVSFGQLRFQPPLKMKIESAPQGENGDGQVWIDPSGSAARISISTRPRTNRRQRRPIVSNQPAVRHSADLAGLLAFDGAHVAVSSGQINGLPFTRIASNPDAPAPHSIDYIAPIDANRWLIVHLTGLPESGLLPKIMELSVRTIRKADASSPQL